MIARLDAVERYPPSSSTANMFERGVSGVATVSSGLTLVEIMGLGHPIGAR